MQEVVYTGSRKPKEHKGDAEVTQINNCRRRLSSLKLRKPKELVGFTERESLEVGSFRSSTWTYGEKLCGGNIYHMFDIYACEL